jgi:hypothetical protein
MNILFTVRHRDADKLRMQRTDPEPRPKLTSAAPVGKLPLR